MRVTTRGGLLALVVAVALLAGGSYLAAAPQDSPASNGLGAIQASPLLNPSTGTVRAVWMGDSYTAGAGTDASVGVAPLTMESLCWQGRVFGQGGTGYLNSGPSLDSSTFIRRVPQVVGERPDVVVVQGSTNDIGRAGVGVAASKVYREIKTMDPGATVIAIGPVAPPKLDSAKVVAVRDELETAAQENGVVFIDPIARNLLPADNPANFVADGIHPSPEGHRKLAAGLRLLILANIAPRLKSCAVPVP